MMLLMHFIEMNIEKAFFNNKSALSGFDQQRNYLLLHCQLTKVEATKIQKYGEVHNIPRAHALIFRHLKQLLIFGIRS